MVNCAFDEANLQLHPPPGMRPEECEPIDALVTEAGEGCQRRPVVVTCWKLTQAEIEHLLKGGRLWLTVMGTTMPPVKLTADKPF